LPITYMNSFQIGFGWTYPACRRRTAGIFSSRGRDAIDN
jgi:hypothetical protein